MIFIFQILHGNPQYIYTNTVMHQINKYLTSIHIYVYLIILHVLFCITSDIKPRCICIGPSPG